VRGEETVEKQVGSYGSAVCIAKYSTQSTVQDMARRPVQWWFDAILLCTVCFPCPRLGRWVLGNHLHTQASRVPSTSYTSFPSPMHLQEEWNRIRKRRASVGNRLPDVVQPRARSWMRKAPLGIPDRALHSLHRISNVYRARPGRERAIGNRAAITPGGVYPVVTAPVSHAPDSCTATTRRRHVSRHGRIQSPHP